MSRGSHTGWSMDKVPVQLVDEITGIEYTEYEDRYVPGIEFLGAGIAFAGLVFGLTFIGYRQDKQQLHHSS